MQVLGLHTIRPTLICRNTLLEQYTDVPSKTLMGEMHIIAYHGILKAETASMLSRKTG
jgi:hypothetical protein